MSSSTPGLTEHPPEPAWLDGPGGRLAWYPSPVSGAWLRVLISHGFGEYAGWWHHVARALAARGVAVGLYDQYHHGRSDGAAGDAPDYEVLAGGFRTALQALQAMEGGPVVVLGHSNGALIALHGLRDIPPDEVPGLALSAPFLDMPPRLVLVGGLVARLLHLFAPRLRVPNLIRPHRLTTETSIWPQYRSDPLRFRHLTPRFFLAMRRAIGQAPHLPFPQERALLVLVAGEEKVVSLPALRGFFQGAEARDKTLREYPGLRHELFNAPVWEYLVDEVTAWCRERFGGAGAAPRAAGD